MYKKKADCIEMLRGNAALVRRRMCSLPFTSCGHPLVNVAPLLQTDTHAHSHVDAHSHRDHNEPMARTQSRTQSVAHLREALLDHGYFYAANVELLTASYLSEIYAYAHKAHAISPHLKHKYRQRGGLGSYSGPDVGQFELQYDPTAPRASVCAWDYSRARFTLGGDPIDPSSPLGAHDDASSASSRSSSGVSAIGAESEPQSQGRDGHPAAFDPRYPPASVLDPPFAVVLDELYRRQDEVSLTACFPICHTACFPHEPTPWYPLFHEQLGRALMRSFEQALELPPCSLLGRFEGGDFGTIRLLQYPGGGDGSGSGIGAHTDFEVFTLMHQDAPGLQLLRREPGGGHMPSWIDAPVRPAEFVVIIGDALERLTNGAVRATPHRVLECSHPRNSIIRFNAFRPGALIEPLPQFGAPRYSTVTMERHMETTMRNLEAGLGSWDADRQCSQSASYDYSNQAQLVQR